MEKGAVTHVEDVVRVHDRIPITDLCKAQSTGSVLESSNLRFHPDGLT